MASNYTGLGVQLMTTGEKAGTWGTLTNTNWNIMEQISGGYTTQAVTDGADTDLAVSDGSTGATLANRIIELTGSLTSGRNVTIPLDVEQFYIIKNATSGSQIVTFKYVSGSGSSVAIANAATVIVYATANDGTNPDIVDTGFGTGDVTLTGTQTLSNKTLTEPKFVSGGFIADANGAEMLVFDTVASALNEVKITNSGTGTAGPIIASQGQTNSNLQLRPAGTGKITVGTTAANATISSNGAHDLVLETNEGTNSGNITLTDAADGDIDFTCNGAGNVVFNDAAYAPETSLVDGATIAWDVQDKPITKVTLTANRIVGLPTNGQAGQFISLLVIQDAGGTNTLTWNAVFEFPAETAPVLTTTGDLADLFVFRYHNSKWLQVGATLALTVA
jgi:hypothetical protein